MTSFLLVLLTLAFTSVNASEDTFAGPTTEYSYVNLPIVHTAPATVSSLKYNPKISYIAVDFVPIVLLADSTVEVVLHSHYLPIHGLNQEKEYFLLI